METIYLASSKSRAVMVAILVGVAYYSLAKLGYVLSSPPDHIANFWPPNAVILAALLLSDRRRWWIYLLAMTLSYLVAATQAGFSLQRTIIFYVANVTEILIAVLGLNYSVGNRIKFDQLREMIFFILWGVVIAPFVSAILASTATFSEPQVDYWLAWRIWFLGDGLGHLSLTPVIVLWLASGLAWVKQISFTRFVEALALALSLFAVAYYSLGVEIGAPGILPFILYTPFPLLLWAAIRFGPQGICSAVFIILLMAIWNATNGRGPFTTNSPADNVLSLQLFLITVSIPTMLLGFLLSELKRSKQKFSHLQTMLEQANNVAKMGAWEFDLVSTKLIWSDVTKNIHEVGLDYEPTIEEGIHFYKEGIHRDTISRIVQEAMEKGRSWDEELIIITAKGNEKWVRAMGQPEHRHGVCVRLYGSFQDITRRKQAEEELQTVSSLNEKIFSESPIGMAIYDSTGQCIAANSSIAAMIGATKEQVLSQNYNNIDSWKKGGLVEVAKNCIRKQKNMRHEFDLLSSLGRQVYFDGVFSPFVLHGKQHLLLMLDDISERKTTELTLIESEALLEKAQAMAHVGHWELNPATGDVQGSNELFQIFGLSREEASLESFLEVVHPEDKEMDIAAIQRGMEHGEPWDIEHRLVCRDGTEKWVRALGEATQDQTGHVDKLVGTIQDITEHKRAREALRDSELWMKNIYNSLDEAVLVISPERKLININEAATKIFGYGYEELISSSTELFHVDHQHYMDFGNRISKAFSQDQTAHFEFVARRKNGEIFPSEHTVSLLKDSSGKAKGIISVVRDITERKSAEQEFERIFELSLDMIGTGSLNGYFTKVNSSFSRILGYDSEEFLAKPFLEFVHEEDVENTLSTLDAALKGVKKLYVENRYMCKDKSFKWIEWNILALADENKFYATGRDFTDRKQAEAELTKHREHLEDLVSDRTYELRNTQDELVRKERLATLGQLTATVSHELRNPLGAMRPALYIIENTIGKNTDSKLLRSIELLNRNIERCDHIVDELLDFTRIAELARQTCQIDNWLDSVIEEQNIPDGIHVEKDYSLKGVAISFDPDRLRRAVINIVENACHAMMDENQQIVAGKDAGLFIKTQSTEGCIVISIRDTGSGITEDVLEKIFEPLFSTKGFGVGLGMPTVKQILEQHGGGVGIVSEKDLGTTVTMWLPMNTG